MVLKYGYGSEITWKFIKAWIERGCMNVQWDPRIFNPDGFPDMKMRLDHL